MSKRKRVAVTTAIICALFGIIYLAVSFCPIIKIANGRPCTLRLILVKFMDNH